MTNGGADYSFECIGLASLMNDAFFSTRKVFSLLKFILFVIRSPAGFVCYMYNLRGLLMSRVVERR